MGAFINNVAKKVLAILILLIILKLFWIVNKINNILYKICDIINMKNNLLTGFFIIV